MLLLQLVLLTVLVPGGDSDDDFPGPNSFRIILTTTFYNRSWTQNLGSAWLDELQTHGWDSKTGILIHLRPWSKGNFSNRELMEQERSLHAASIAFPLIFQNHVSQWQLEYPFQVQLVKGCVLPFGEAPAGFFWIAYQGSDLMSFQNTSWWPSPKGGRRAQQVSKLFNQYHVVNLRIQAHVNDICPRFLLGLLDAGKADLQRQEQHRPVSLVFLAVVVPLVLLAGLAFWLWKRWKSHWRPQCTGLPLERDPSSPGPGRP